MPHESVLAARERRFAALDEELDVLVVGGGISGSPLYHELCRRGYRTAIIDRGDFASGTSQASGMLVWGGLLYLKDFDLLTVLKLCRARAELLRQLPDDISTLTLAYLVNDHCRRGNALLACLFYLYWLMGGCALERPRLRKYPAPHDCPAWEYQEARLNDSDSRFVIDFIRPFQSEHHLPLNHCSLQHARLATGGARWHLGLRDEITGRERTATARVVVNAAGAWVDQLNTLLGLESPVKHVFSKGVYLALAPEPGDNGTAHIHPMPGADDVLTHVPWGPVMMWGPTETPVRDPELGMRPEQEDVRFLIEHAQVLLKRTIGPDQVVSIRTGVRSLAVPRNYSREVYPLELSRAHRIVSHRGRHALSIYGGKFTSAQQAGLRVADRIARMLAPRLPPAAPRAAVPETYEHPEFHRRFVTARWARDHEFCTTLDDYLRRRTTLAQWTPRMGLGRNGQGRLDLLSHAAAFASRPDQAAALVEAYQETVRTTHDRLLEFS